MNINLQTLDLTVGPLCYRLLAHDSWAAGLLGRIGAAIDAGSGSTTPLERIHLLQRPLCDLTMQQIEAQRLPKELAACVAEALPTDGWECSGHELLYQVWRHPESQHLFWTEGREHDPTPFSFHLPWQVILQDILQAGGVILHGGLAVREGRGCLFTAPPGGGKSTALACPTAGWQVLADDATLLWPVSDGRCMASPLPTWSVLLGAGSRPEQIASWQLSRQVPVHACMLLEKSPEVRFSPVPPVEAAYPLYRACSEYPAVILSRHELRGQVFHNACALARAVPAWQLELTRQADFWPLLNERLEHDQAR